MSEWIVVPIWGPDRPNESLHPFVNLIDQMNRRTPSGTRSPKQIVVPLRGPGRPNEPMHLLIVVPIGTNVPNLGAPLMLVHPNLLVASYLGKPLGAFACPRRPLTQLGCRSNPKYFLLEDLGEGLYAHLVEDLTILISCLVFNFIVYCGVVF